MLVQRLPRGGPVEPGRACCVHTGFRLLSSLRTSCPAAPT
ncbi:hypothetical protein SLNHY_5950 [Streptomyces albus]|nr:hypothetical protein SLNHY_5950 [Streptomyces albus]